MAAAYYERKVYDSRNPQPYTASHRSPHPFNFLPSHHSTNAFANEMKYGNEPKYVNMPPQDAKPLEFHQLMPSDSSRENEHPEMGTYNTVTRALRNLSPPPVPARNIQNDGTSKVYESEWKHMVASSSVHTRPALPPRTYNITDNTQTKASNTPPPLPLSANGIPPNLQQAKSTSTSNNTDAYRGRVAAVSTQDVREEDMVDGLHITDDECSDIDDIDGERTKYPHARWGLVGLIVILLAACMLIVPVVVSADPWNDVHG